VLALAAGAAWAGYILLGRRVASAGSGIDSLAVGMVFGALVYAPFAVGTAAGALASVRSTAMALGRPVVVSSLPALRELTALGASRSFPPGDAEALARVLIRMAAESGGRSGPASAGDPSQPPGPLSCPPQQGLPTWDANAARQIEIYKELV